jgi:hypothetical protein
MGLPLTSTEANVGPSCSCRMLCSPDEPQYAPLPLPDDTRSMGLPLQVSAAVVGTEGVTWMGTGRGAGRLPVGSMYAGAQPGGTTSGLPDRLRPMEPS